MKKNLSKFGSREWRLLSLLFCLAMAGCVSSGRSVPAPVEDHVSLKNKPAAKSTTGSTASAPASISAGSMLPDQAAKTGYYTVKPGDTLIRIGLDHGQNWRDLMRWNTLDNPNLIEVGQVLRVAPPPASSQPEEVVVKPVAPLGQVSGAQADAKSHSQNQALAQTTSPTDGIEEQLTFLWPAQGQVITPFDDAKNKGIDIGGKPGDPVLAAADGRVVYSGAGLRGYGNLVILKHNNTYLSAYAHNQNLLVKEDQIVKRGQKIAEMGNSDSEQVKLHFEIRKMGKPIDPTKILAPR